MKKTLKILVVCLAFIAITLSAFAIMHKKTVRSGTYFDLHIGQSKDAVLRTLTAKDNISMLGVFSPDRITVTADDLSRLSELMTKEAIRLQGFGVSTRVEIIDGRVSWISPFYGNPNLVELNVSVGDSVDVLERYIRAAFIHNPLDSVVDSPRRNQASQHPYLVELDQYDEFRNSTGYEWLISYNHWDFTRTDDVIAIRLTFEDDKLAEIFRTDYFFTLK
ncbi:hypothetical protein [Yoonia sp. I 8.24]|uniref:hypothetical protein n=1 Tax=Yoonia sp. I 8.24 TaxID=1537229 RepID=UPI001EE13501|nr:hypothetical protein [Yoonia sp. I 8.24]MCG3268363.1 hypothetical protein [Yoonia sp. I 8.24]